MELKDLIANYIQDKAMEIANDPDKNYESELMLVLIDLAAMPEADKLTLLTEYKNAKVGELQASVQGLDDQKAKAEAELTKNIDDLTKLDVKVVSVKDPGVILKK